MMKKITALFVMALILCWAASAMALTAVAPDTIARGMTAWTALEPQADFMRYKLRFGDGSWGSATAESGNYQLVIRYDSDARPSCATLYANKLNDQNDRIEVVCQPRGAMVEARYWTDYVKRTGKWSTSYAWDAGRKVWLDANGAAVAGIPAFDEAAYALTIIYAGEEVPPDKPRPEIRVTVDNPLGKLAILVGDAILDYTGFEKFEGADFYFEHGVVRDDMNGLTMIDGVWYNMDAGRVNTDEGLVFFEGGVFYVRGGVIAYDMDGMVPYDGEWFVFSNGQFQPQVYGAWPDHRSGRFVYIWGGQFYPITDLVSYDGQIFYFIDGYLATDFVGIVKDFKGTEFYVAYGQVY